VDIAAAKSFILNRGIVTDTMSATPPRSRMVCSAFHSTKTVKLSLIVMPREREIQST